MQLQFLHPRLSSSFLITFSLALTQWQQRRRRRSSSNNYSKAKKINHPILLPQKLIIFIATGKRWNVLNLLFLLSEAGVAGRSLIETRGFWVRYTYPHTHMVLPLVRCRCTDERIAVGFPFDAVPFPLFSRLQLCCSFFLLCTFANLRMLANESAEQQHLKIGRKRKRT